MKLVHYVLRGDSLLLSSKGYGGAMLVAARDHKHIIAFGPMVTGKYVGGKVGSGYMAQMQGPIGIGPSYRYEDPLGQSYNLPGEKSL